MKRKGLEARVKRKKVGIYPFHNIVRAELDRLARKIKQLQRVSPAPVKGCHCQICRVRDHANGAYLNRQDVLALLREARK